MKWEESVITIPKTMSSTHVHELTHTSILGSGTQQIAVNPSKNSEFFFLSTSILLELLNLPAVRSPRTFRVASP